MGIVLEILQSENLKIIREQVEQYCYEIMKEYLFECENFCKKFPLSNNKTKNFNDSVWGTIEINDGEIRIIDSPIVQRLRNIKQLGLADLLYSSADHSRYAHTLGVIRTADVMQKQIEKELKKKGIVSDNDVNQLIRLSAIFHDCGHTFCSHASERYFQKSTYHSQYKEIEKERNYIKNSINIKPSLSEIIATFIVQSQAIRKLLKIVANGLNEISINSTTEDVIIEKICCFIWGYPYSEKLLAYSQIISGQIDADKLDYLKRDSHSTGVPAAVDMSRVFQKLRVVESTKNYKMKSTSEEDVDTRYTIAIAPVAINTVDQLIISRYMMFENVYFHQKTLTAETLLRYALEKIDESTKGLLDNFRNIMMFQDSHIVSNNFELSAREIIPEFQIINKDEFAEACKLLKNLYTRKLFKRSVAFTSENIVDVGHNGYEFYSKLFSIKSFVDQEKFVELIKKTTNDIKNLLLNTIYESKCDTDILLIVSPDISNININSNLAIAEKNNKYRDMEFEADNWLKSRASRKPQNYLITYPEDRYIVYVATEYVLLTEYGLMLSDSIIYDDNDMVYINKIKKELEKKNFYNTAYPIAPNDAIDVHNREIEELVKEKWKYYELVSSDTGFANSMDVSYLKMFLKQFYQFKQNDDYKIFVSECIKMLNHVEIISKEEIIKSLQKNLKSIVSREKCNFDSIKVCNIGNVQDGGAQVAYQINQINEAFKSKLQVKSLEKSLKFSEENQIIVFIEDAFCSGKQILSIFETYMGIPLDERQTQEIHVDELSDENKEKLKNSKLYFSFIMYNEENKEYFINRLNEIGLKKVEIIATKPFPNGYFKDVDLDDNLKILKRYFLDAGKLLINQKATEDDGAIKANWSEDRMENSLLGYNDSQQLIVFAWNTPTYTLTPLWMQGKRNFKWYPLFPRIDK